MKNTRELILKTLAMTRQATITKLSEQLEINPITVRHHLLILEEKGLIMTRERRHGVGRPHFIYRLTDKGQQEVTSNYRHLSESLLSKIEQRYGDQALSEIMDLIGHDMAPINNLDAKDNLDGWMDNFCDLMAEQGYQVDWEVKGDRVYIHNTSCPYYHLKQTHPEICSMDRSLFSHVLAKELRFEEDLSAKGPGCIYSYEV
jgi:predicted ArsR family transcriptional regulator